MTEIGNTRSVALFPSYWALLAGHRKRATLAVALVVVSGLMETVGILALVPILGSQEQASALGIRLQGSGLRYVAVGAFVVFGLAASGARLLGERAIIRTLADFERSRRQELTKAALEMDWASYLVLRLGDVNTSLLLTVTQVSQGIQLFMRTLGILGVVFVFVLVAVSLSWQLSLFTLGFGMVAVVIYVLAANPTKRHTTALTEAASMLGREADLLFGNLKLFRSLGGRSSSEHRMNEIYAEYSGAFMKSQFIGPRTRSIFESTGIVGIAVVLLGAVISSRGAMLSATSIAFLVVFLRLAPRFVSAQESLQATRAYRRWCDIWRDTLEAMKATPMFRGGTTPPRFESELRANGLAFTYPGTDRPVLHDVDWAIGPGEAIAFVGESGAGKTTILDLVTSLLHPTAGSLTIDGVELDQIDLEEWQSHLGIVMQEPPLLAGTVLENVYWTEAERDESRARVALERAHALTFVDRLPQGIDTVLGQRGGTLSGGERQRLALARALYRQPWLLILDEPTSALDADAENEVLRALAGIRSSCGMIIVAHGLDPVRLADRIYVIAGGTVVEHGSWEQLVALPGGLFADMVRRRASFR